MNFEKWRTVVALIPLIIAVVMQWWWFFTLLFVLQIIFSISSGKVEYVEEVKKEEHPILFWIVIAVWTFLACYSLSYYFL